MSHGHLVDDKAVERIKKQGCCLGKYRMLLSDGYYCFLEKVFDCPHQDRRYVKAINGYMLVCKTNKQRPCEECDIYLKLKSETAVIENK